MRRTLLAARALALALALAAASPAGAIDVVLTPIANGFAAPSAVRSAPGDLTRLFVTELGGRIRIWDGAQILATPFLDIDARVLTQGEQGLFGMAFHPDFPNTPYVYVSYTLDDPANANDGDSIVSRFALLPGDPNQLDATSELVLLQYAQPFANHNGGDLHFGPDGYLYIGSGDGGSGNDPNNNGQTLTTLLGKMLRIDVDATDPGKSYAVPATNPFANAPPALPEIWAYGLRNPWRFSFDRATGDMYIGDVGQGAREEVSFEPAASAGGLDFGWKVMEGDICRPPTTGCNTTGLELPILVYAHANPCESITGGFRHRGTQSTALNGLYFFSEGCSPGRVWAASESSPGSGSWTFEEVAAVGGIVTSFGEDADGELYLVDLSHGELVHVPEPGAAAAAVSALAALGALRGAHRGRSGPRRTGAGGAVDSAGRILEPTRRLPAPRDDVA
ncbi:MAG: PQQ-dependent sugar dehydrogenase [Myxococcota bacterium]